MIDTDETKSDTHRSEQGVPDKYLAKDPATSEMKSDEIDPTKRVETTETKSTPTRSKKKASLKTFFSSKKGRLILVLGGIALIIVILFSIPTTRYLIAGTVVKKDVAFVVVDSGTHQPVTQAQVAIAGKTAKSDTHGKVVFKQIPVGSYDVAVTKMYYKNAHHAALVPILASPQMVTVNLEATGRQVPITILNKITGKPIEKADISAAGASALTDASGMAVVVVPADKPTIDGTVTLAGYIDLSITIQVTDQKSDKNSFAITPSGKLYFLSKRTGTINVMKSNLDGTNQTVVLAGTGNESDKDTVLLASRDWKYLILKAQRDTNADTSELYLIDTTNNDKLITIDQGNASFNPVGWYGHHFIFTVSRNNLHAWDPKQQALKTYDADTQKLTLVDETNAVGSQSAGSAAENIGSTYILDNAIFYAKDWYGYNNQMNGQQITLASVQPDGTNKKILKQFNKINGTNITYLNDVKLYKPQSLYIRLQLDFNGGESFWEYENGQVTENKDITDSTFNKTYPTFLVSPSGQKTFWYESRDGKNALFMGDPNAGQAKEIGDLTDYTPYGWYGDGYVLLSKSGSELYIAPADAPITDQNILKITDYHKPAANFYGYGYGYGGL